MQNNGVVDANMAMAAIEAGFDEKWVFQVTSGRRA
jgi:hypothetical protein